MPLLHVGRHRSWLAVSVVLLLAAAPLEAQRSVLDAQIDALNARAESEGMRPAFPPSYGTLREDEQAQVKRRLTAGSRYVVYGVCDTDCDDFDLAVTGPDGRTEASDILEDDRPIVTFVAARTGEYTITAGMASCDGVCGYAVVVLGAGGPVTTAGTPASPERCTTSAAGSSLQLGERVSGTLSSLDCLRGDGTHADYHRLTLPGRTAVTITMQSGDFDAYLALADASGDVIDSNDDGGEGRDARITRTLDAGTYYVIANAVSRSTGDYRLAVERADGGRGGSAGDACALSSVRPELTAGRTVRGSLTASACRRSDGSYADVYRLVIPSSRNVTVTMRSGAFDAYLSLRDAGDGAVASDDDSGGGTDARLSLRLQAGTYYLFANTLRSDVTGAYTILLHD